MKKIIFALFLMMSPAFAANEIIAQEAGSDTPVTMAVSGDRLSAAQFIHVISQARYSLAIDDRIAARGFINQAKTLDQKLEKSSAHLGPIARLRSGRVGYESGAEGNFYFPSEAKLITKKKVALGPFWASKANKGLAVKDAEFIYLTVDLRDKDVPKKLDKALDKLNNNDPKAADNELEDLLDDVAKIDEKEAASIVKAADNLELANYYMAAKNYDAARYPLKHARDALEKMQDDADYADQKTKITNYLAQIDQTEDVIQQRDPRGLEKLKQEVKSWWDDVKTWSKRKKK